MKRTSKPSIHLVCNAHLDPVWQWRWEEGAGEALSTFRHAADFCEEFKAYIFNHNEAILYEWIERFDPALFARIQRLVRRGRWHIMGGWYLQPDCNMPSGESIVRQITAGRRYFLEKFDVAPSTAINFDPFGHSRGLVQILAKSGFDSYLVCRPGGGECELPGEEFIWKGYDGSQVIGVRAFGFYLSVRGQARKKVEDWIAEQKDLGKPGLILWGVGDHGGGPSRVDLQELTALIKERKDYKVMHSTPEAYIQELKQSGRALPVYDGELNPSMVGCYTSQIRVKQRHRQLENELYSAEKMASAAALQGLMRYPADELDQAQRDLMLGQFHDVLPGSSVQVVEEDSLRLMDHGLEIVSRVKGQAFFALAQGQPRPEDGTLALMVYNPHPFPVRSICECEFQLADQHHEQDFVMPTVERDGQTVDSQCEKENSNINMNWRKRVVFEADLQPATMNRFDCRLVTLPRKPLPALKPSRGRLVFKSERLEVVINTATGLMDRYRVDGVDYLKKDAFLPLVMEDDEDSWAMRVRSIRKVAGHFRLMDAGQIAQHSPHFNTALEPVRVIEDGPVRSVVEAVFGYGRSAIVYRYKLPKQGSEVEIEARVYWGEQDRMLKVALPTDLKPWDFCGQSVYGTALLPSNGDEAVAQKWVMLSSLPAQDKAVTVVNDGTYGCSLEGSELRLTLLRSPGYCAHPVFNRPVLSDQLFVPRMEQGERLFHFWLNGGPVAARREAVDREATARNEVPQVLALFPRSEGRAAQTAFRINDEVVQVAAIQLTPKTSRLLVRFFEPSGTPRTFEFDLPTLGMRVPVSIGAYEIKTVAIDVKRKTYAQTDFMGQKL